MNTVVRLGMALLIVLIGITTVSCMAALRGVRLGAAALGTPSDAGGGSGTRGERFLRRRDSKADVPPSLQPGTLMHGGVSRSYYTYMPPGYTGQRPLPLVMVFHGGHSNAATMARTTLFHELGDREHFIVVYPEAIATDRVWNDGRNTTASPVNDVAFVDALLRDLMGSLKVDSHRVYATGASNGGMFTLRLACERSSTFAAFAPVVANLPVDFVSKCQPTRPVPILLTNGTADVMMPWNGGEVAGLRILGRGKGYVISSSETHKFWVQRNGCDPQPTIDELPDKDPRDGTRVKAVRYHGCRANAETGALIVEGGGHTWPGSPQPPTVGKAGKTSHDIDATVSIWQFFAKHALP